MLLVRARESTMGFFRPILQKNNLSEQQWRVLRVLHEDPNVSARHLAERCHILSPSLTRILSRLENESLITRERLVDDLREQRIRLTDAGEKLFDQVAPQIDFVYAELRSRMQSERLDQLYELLDELIEMNTNIETE